jgi:hypothetical protein
LNPRNATANTNNHNHYLIQRNVEALRLTVLTGFLLNCEIPRSCGWHSRTAPLLKS